MFKVKYFDEEYLVYSVNYDEENGQTLFLIYDNVQWKWIDSFLCEPIRRK